MGSVYQFTMKQNLAAIFLVGAVGVCVCASAGVQPAFAGAWPMEAGKGQSISTMTWQGSTRGFDRRGEASVDLSFQKFENAVFLEYGLTENWTVVARPALQNVRLRVGDVVDEANGFGATEFSVRRVLPGWEKWVLSAQTGVFMPGEVENGFNKPLGQNGLDWEIRALAGRSLEFAGRPGFVDIQAAFRERSHGAGNEVRLDMTLGSMAMSRVQLHFQSFIVIGLPSSRPGIHTVDSFKTQLSGVWFFKESQGLQLSLSRTLSGRNIVRDTGMTIGFWQRF